MRFLFYVFLLNFFFLSISACSLPKSKKAISGNKKDITVHLRSKVINIPTCEGHKRSVLCDHETNGGGWIVIQQRMNGKTLFWNRTWVEYRDGFGSIGMNSNFYIGNLLIHQLTSRNATLRIELIGDRNPNSTAPDCFYFQEYSIRVDDESENFTLHIWLDSDKNKRIGNGTHGYYDITYSDGVPFSTIDRVNNPDLECQKKFRIGGWWSQFCGMGALNGEYEPQKWGDGFGLFFVVNGQFVINPRKTRMLIR
ncbi:hypothetical protein M3Y96_00156700 [Aphelenchoides besseyi]|nr:hypothetical protein M3Y96_00156700 [Aphelenchoides besseyi]